MNSITYRLANINDLETYFKWLNDPQVREFSFSSDKISFEEHCLWFKDKLSNQNFFFYIFQNNQNQLIGQVRIQKTEQYQSTIGISVCSEHRGYGYGKEMLKLATLHFFNLNPNFEINAFIKKENNSSRKIFQSAGFKLVKELLYSNYKSDHFKLCK
jgi:RimJ/RimL family protein N-acetyltransferase